MSQQTMHPACAACGGACCEFISLPTVFADPQDRAWLEHHGVVAKDGLHLNCQCLKLQDGRCSIYADRPRACRDCVVGGPVCQEAIRTRRADRRDELIALAAPGRALSPKAPTQSEGALDGRLGEPSLPDPDVVQCRLPVEFAAETAPEEIMFMPAGTHEIHATQGDKPITIRVAVNPEAAGVIHGAFLRQRDGGGRRPYFDFNHEDRDASAWPVNFAWKDGVNPGIYAKVEWSQAGLEAVAGKSFRTFSPSFFVSKKSDPAQVTGAPLNMGGLVNNPAFAAMKPLWAKDGRLGEPSLPGRDPSPKGPPDDPPSIAAAASAAAVATNTQNQNASMLENNTAAAAVPNAADALKAKDTEITSLQAKLAEADQAILAMKQRQAEAALKVHIARGAIAPKDEATKAKYLKLLVDDPGNEVLLENIPDNPALKPVTAGAKPGNGQMSMETDVEGALKAYFQLGGEISKINAKRDDAVAKQLRRENSLERGRIYKREFSPILAKGGDIPLDTFARRMEDQAINAAYSTGTLVGNLISQRVLELLRFQLPVLGRITTDFSAEQVKFNQTVYTRYYSVPTVGSYSSGYSAATTGGATDATLAMSSHKYLEIDLSTETLGGTARRMFQECAPVLSYGLAKDLVDAIYALIVVGTYTATTIKAGTTESFGRDKIIDAAVAQTLAGVPVGPLNRTLLLYPSYYGALQKDTGIVTLASFRAPEIIEAGILPNVAGYQVIEAANLPTTSNMVGFGFSRSALLACTRVPIDYTTVLPGASYGVAQVVTDPDTGASMMQVEFVSHSAGTACFRLAWMYGVGAGQVAAGQIVVSS